MYIFKNAWKSITRSFGRNILIGIIVFVIAASSCVALAIRSSANEVVKQQKESYKITATLGIDRNSIMNSSTGYSGMRSIMSKIPAITLTELKKYADSKYVKSLTYSGSVSLDSSNITAVSNSADNASSSGTKNNRFSERMGGGMGTQMSAGNFKLVGYSSTAAMSDFISGTDKITSGAMFSDSDTGNDCVITDQLAKANNLKVGSKITLTNTNKKSEASTFKVVGIYKDTSTTGDTPMNFFSNAANNIITNYAAVNNIVTASAKDSGTKLTSQLSSTFTLTNANAFDNFKAELKAKGLSKYYTAISNIDSFNQSVEPLTNLSNYATIFLILVLLIGGVILIVLNMFNIRERKYEVGVLRAIGMKKWKVASQFVIELFIVTFIFITVGTVAGGISSVPVASAMLKNEVSTLQSQQSQISQNFGRGGQAPQGDLNGRSGRGGGIGGFFGTARNVSYVSQINAVINFSVILQIILIGILLTLLSSLISMIFISRYEPLKILSSRT